MPGRTPGPPGFWERLRLATGAQRLPEVSDSAPVHREAGECQQRISDFEEYLEIVSSRPLFYLPLQNWSSERLRARGSRPLALEQRGGAGVLALPHSPCPHTAPSLAPCTACQVFRHCFLGKLARQPLACVPVAPACLPAQHWPPGPRLGLPLLPEAESALYSVSYTDN